MAGSDAVRPAAPRLHRQRGGMPGSCGLGSGRRGSRLQGRAIQTQGWHPRPAKAPQGATSPAPAAPSPPPPAASAPRASAAARAPRKPVHPRQPLVGSAPAPRRATPRRPRPSRAAPQAQQDARRTFHEPRGPPATDADRGCKVGQFRHKGGTRDPQRPPRAPRAPRQPRLARPRLLQALRGPAQQRTRCGSQCRPANRSPECALAPPRAVRRRAEPERSRAAPQARPGTRRTFHEPRGPPAPDAERACEGRAIQTRVAPTPQHHARTP
jgi:hypothetical protein